MRHLMN